MAPMRRARRQRLEQIRRGKVAAVSLKFALDNLAEFAS
jgi:hypothetical protein